MPYGGLKGSGIGKEGPRSAVAEMTEVKTDRPPRPALVAATRTRSAADAGGRPMPTDTVRLTVAQALVTYLSRQYSRRRRRSAAGSSRQRWASSATATWPGSGQALDQLSDALPFIQGRNEQALVHAATGYAKATRRHATLAVTASIGPGALNMVTGAGAGHRQPAAGAAAARRHVRHPPPGPGAAAAAAPGRGRRHRQRRVPPGVPVLRPHHPARAAAHRPARGDAGADRPGRHRRRRARPCRRTFSPTPTTSRPSSSPSATGRSAARRPTRTRSRRWPRCSPRRSGR